MDHRKDRDDSTDSSARRLLHELNHGEQIAPMLRLPLLDALTRGVGDRPNDPDAFVSDNARAAAQWIGVSPDTRGEALQDLLELGDARPPTSGSAEISTTEKLTAIGEAMSSAGIPHAIGGAIALAYYAEPRMTPDIDINIFLSIDQRSRACDALTSIGAQTEVDEESKARSEAKLIWEEREIHLFFSHDELHEAMPGAVRRMPFGEGTLPIVSPEHLIVRKAILNRDKDWHDIEQVLVATPALEIPEVERWLVVMVGASDPRLAQLKELARSHWRNRDRH